MAKHTLNLKKYTETALIFLGLFIVFLWVGLSAYGLLKPLPNGIDYESPIYSVPASSIAFFNDRTFINKSNELTSDQRIFDSMMLLIDDAKEFIMIDMFLINDFKGTESIAHRSLSSELMQKLINKKNDNKNMKVIVITDPINTAYGSDPSEQLQQMEDAGITVITTDLEPLRESNFIYAGLYQIFFQWWGNSENGHVAHPLDSGKKSTIRTYLHLANFKANHRKTMLLDDGNGHFISMITSFNPHDGSSRHSNVAILVKDGIWKDLYQTESAVAAMSNKPLQPLQFEKFTEEKGLAEVQLLTENAIKRSLLSELRQVQENDEVNIAMFYLSDTDVIEALLKASERKATIRIILDPNKEAFGHEKNGIPNRAAANLLFERSHGRIEVKWYDTHGEQFHTKFIMIKRNGKVILFVGSANLTRRNLDNFNLETDVKLSVDERAPIAKQVNEYFENVWGNKGYNYVVPFITYRDDSLKGYILLYIQEELGLGTF